MPIKIYDAEKEAGLAEQILTKASVACHSPALVDKEPNKELALACDAIKNHAIATNTNQPDLFYIKDILVSTGWNLNEDVFDLRQTWAARRTSEDKQFNLEHNIKGFDKEGERIYHNNIIGHITSQYCIDNKGEVISDDLKEEELPEQFHIVNSSVIYRYWQEPEMMEKMTNIIAEIETQTKDKPKWFVSMEALFDDFDYALMDSKGRQVILPRNNSSAFLTKHLRAYGGKGVYRDYKIGRLLKDLVFSGKGLTSNPANPNSVILTDSTPFKAAASLSSIEDLGYTTSSSLILTETKDMNELEALKKQLSDVQAALAAESKAKSELEKKLVEEANKAVQAKADELTKAVSEAKASVSELEGKLKNKESELTEVSKKLSESEEALKVSLKEPKFFLASYFKIYCTKKR
jgi:hypothetical protein